MFATSSTFSNSKKGANLTEDLYKLFHQFISEGSRCVPDIDLLTELVDGPVTTAAKRKRLRKKFRSWAARMDVRQSDGKLVYKTNGKVIVPKESYVRTIAQKHCGEGAGAPHLSAFQTLEAVMEEYSVGKREFGIDRDLVIAVANNCPEAQCNRAQRLARAGAGMPMNVTFGHGNNEVAPVKLYNPGNQGHERNEGVGRIASHTYTPGSCNPLITDRLKRQVTTRLMKNPGQANFQQPVGGYPSRENVYSQMDTATNVSWSSTATNWNQYQLMQQSYPEQEISQTQFLGQHQGEKSDVKSVVSNYPSTNTNYPSINTNYPSINTNYPSINTNYPSTNANYTSINANYPSINANYPSINTNYPSTNTNYPSINANYPSINTNYPMDMIHEQETMALPAAQGFANLSSYPSLTSGYVVPTQGTSTETDKQFPFTYSLNSSMAKPKTAVRYPRIQPKPLVSRNAQYSEDQNQHNLSVSFQYGPQPSNMTLVPNSQSTTKQEEKFWVPKTSYVSSYESASTATSGSSYVKEGRQKSLPTVPKIRKHRQSNYIVYDLAQIYPMPEQLVREDVVQDQRYCPAANVNDLKHVSSRLVPKQATLKKKKMSRNDLLYQQLLLESRNARVDELYEMLMKQLESLGKYIHPAMSTGSARLYDCIRTSINKSLSTIHAMRRTIPFVSEEELRELSMGDSYSYSAFQMGTGNGVMHPAFRSMNPPP